MTTAAVVLLGVIAASTAIMALGQMMMALRLQRVAVTVGVAVRDLQYELRPILDQARLVTTDAARVSAIAVRQAERADDAITGGIAMLKGAGAAVAALASRFHTKDQGETK